MHEQIFDEICNSNNFLSSRIRFISNRTQKVCIYSVVPLIAVSSISYISTLYIPETSDASLLAKLISISTFLLVLIFGLIYQWSALIPGIIKTIRHPVKIFFDDNKERRNEIFILSETLSHHSKKDLEFALSITKLEAQHLKSRIGLLVGSIESIGIIPLLVTTVISGYSIFSENKIPYVTWIAYGLLSLYIIILPYSLLTHKLDVIILSIENGIKIKEGRRCD